MAFLLLPSEVRLMIYRQLFLNLTVTMRRAEQKESEGPWNIIRTCQLCHIESLPIFYKLTTIKFDHLLSLPVLQERIGAKNMARIQSLAVAGYWGIQSSWLAGKLPKSLRTLYFRWEYGFRYYSRAHNGCLSDDKIATLLLLRQNELDSCVKKIRSHDPDLRMFLDANVGNAPSPQVSASNFYTSLSRKGVALDCGDSSLIILVANT